MIVKGWEGGGHVTFEATTVLVPQAVDLLDIPVVASGGIADGRGVAAGIAWEQKVLRWELHLWLQQRQPCIQM